jgi:hypothetical protein
MLQSQIEQGVYLAHQKLPSERDLCQHHNLSRMTARRALQELIDEGLAYTRVGKGTFVSSTPYPAGKTPAPASSANLNGKLPNGQYWPNLIKSLSTFDSAGVDHTINEVLAAYSIEVVAEKLFFDAIRYFEQKWWAGEISLLVHNYTITTLRSHLIAMMSAAAMSQSGPKVLLACAPGDLHEIGLISLALSLRRRGFLVIYFGPNLTVDEFRQVLDQSQPQLICISAATTEAVKSLDKLIDRHHNRLQTEIQYNGTAEQKPFFTFGGSAFVQNQTFTSGLPGLYLGDTIEQAVTHIQRLVMI